MKLNTTINKITAAFCAATFLALGTANAQSDSGQKRDIYSLKGQHQFTLTAGTLIEDDYVDTQDVGSFEYSYWFSETAAFTIATGGITSDEDHDHWGHHYDNEGDDGVGMLLVGMQLRPDFFNITDRVFFTLEGLVGPYVGVDEYWWEDEFDHHRHGWEEDTETQWGAYLGLNLNVAVTRRFLIGASVGHHFVEEFDYPINGERDYNSPEFRLRFSFVL